MSSLTSILTTSTLASDIKDIYDLKNKGLFLCTSIVIDGTVKALYQSVD